MSAWDSIRKGLQPEVCPQDTPPCQASKAQSTKPSRKMAWALVVANKQVEEVAQTAQGGRNDVLNKAAFTLGSLESITHEFAEARLIEACKQNGYLAEHGEESTLHTIRRAFEEGRAQPMKPPSRGQEKKANKPALTSRLIVRLTRELPADIEAGIRVLAACPDVGVRGGQLVQRVQVPDPNDKKSAGRWEVRALPRPTLKEKLASAQWLAHTNGNWTKTSPSDAIVRGIECRGQWPGLRIILGTVETPYLRDDGSVCDREGYDDQTWYWLSLREPFEPLPLTPTQEEASRALACIVALFRDFPFANEASQYVPIAALLTMLMVPALQGANMPAFLVSANTPGSGKGLIWDLTCLIAFGWIPPKSPWRPIEETEKVIGSVAMEGAQVLFFDNISPNLPFGGSAIELVLTCSGSYKPRILGCSQTPTLPWRTVILGTGNNLQIEGDTRRRVLECQLQTALERPEERTDFQHADLRSVVRQQRMVLVRDALIVLRAHAVAGYPNQVRPLGSFEAWSRVVPSAIVWAGGANVLDAMPRNDASSEDTTLSALKVLLLAWPEMDPTGAGLGMSDLNKLLYGTQNASGLQGSDDLDGVREAFEILAPSKTSNARFDAQRLGRVLRAHQMRNLGGRMFRCGNLRHGAKVWSVIDAFTHRPILKNKEGD